MARAKVSRATQASDTRNHILDAALVVLRRDGVKKFSQPEVARAAGVSQSLLTHHFPKKADLVKAVADRFVDNVSAGLADVTAQGAPARQRGLELLLEWITDPHHMRLFAGVVLEAETDVGLRASLARNVERMHTLFAGLLGYESTDVECRLVLATLWGLGLEKLIFRAKAPSVDARAILGKRRS
jgi:AcrR family transcriptional regulator